MLFRKEIAFDSPDRAKITNTPCGQAAESGLRVTTVVSERVYRPWVKLNVDHNENKTWQKPV